MNYIQNDLTNKIESFIESYSLKRNNQFLDSEAIEEDTKWNASRFFAQVIHKSVSIREKYTYSEFINFKTEYETQNNLVVNDTALFERFWLRNILGYIEIPGTISSACRRFDKIKDSKNEVEFICMYYTSIHEEKHRDTSLQEFEAALMKYNSENGFSINMQSIIDKHWFTNKEGKIELHNLDIYLQPYLDNWNDFLFIYSLQNAYSKELKKLKCLKSDFDNIYNSFKNIYPTIPTIEEFETQRIIQTHESTYLIDFHHSEVRYVDLFDKINGYYWELLISDLSIETDIKRVFIFLSKIYFWEGSYDILSYTTNEAKERFLDSAFQLISDESDLIGVENEFQKIRIDESMGSHGIEAIIYDRSKYEDFSINNEDFFELYVSLKKIENNAGRTYFYGQNSRSTLSFLIANIVRYDTKIKKNARADEDDGEFIYYWRILNLLKKSINRPTLLWEIVSYIRMYRKEIIPHLLIDKDFTSLSFQIIDGFEFPVEFKAELSLLLWSDCLSLALITIRAEVGEDINIAAKLVFQIYRQINRKKYDVAYNYSKPKEEKLLSIEKEKREKKLLELLENSPLHNHTVNGLYDKYLIPEIFEKLIDLFRELKIKHRNSNSCVEFPLLQWDGLIWLMKCSTFWKYKQQFQNNETNIKKLTSIFYDQYVKSIEIEYIDKYNYFDKKQEKGIPIWSEKNERLGLIDWLYPIYFIYINRKLNSFLEINLQIEIAENVYNGKNQFTSQKLRTHLAVLLEVHRKLVLTVIPYGLDKSKIPTIKKRVEEKIIEYMEDYSKDIPQEGKVDLFNFNKESNFNSSDKDALLPQIGRALNWFKDKEGLINAIYNSNDVMKILILAESITSEGIKSKLIEKIDQTDLISFLQESHWIPEVQMTLLKIRNYPQLINQVEVIVDYWEREIATKDTKYEEQLYLTKLLLAYYRSDENELNKVPLPSKKQYISVGEFTNYDYKQFYRALIRLKTNPSEAYNIFDNLSKKHLKYPVLALNRMAAKIQIANEGSISGLYGEALEEWNEYKRANREIDEDSLGSTFLSNKILILLKTQQFAELDKVYNGLELPYRMLPDIIDSKINQLILQNKLEEATLLLVEADNYHKLAGNKDVVFIRDLKSKINNEDNTELLSSYYNRIFNCRPPKLIKIFPEKLNGKTTMNEFMANEIALAADKMLDKIMSISDITSEDKFNDIIELTLDARINPWGWNVSDQSRGGFSNPTDKTEPKQPGERDLPIMDSNQKPFCICEAFIFRVEKTAKDHIEKIFNYYHQKDNLIILIYNLKINGVFETNWKKYLNSIVPNTNYPKDFDFIAIKDVTADFGYQNSGIKVAKSEHNAGIVLHHIFVNINYRTK